MYLCALFHCTGYITASMYEFQSHRDRTANIPGVIHW